MSLLLPQNRPGAVVAAREVDLHGDRFVDVTLALDGEPAPVTSRVAANECPAALVPGERVVARIVVGVVTRLTRA
ncbi:MAG: hypothetical protein U0704_16865 [Candidatus Eisenbacteria bacterium]